MMSIALILQRTKIGHDNLKNQQVSAKYLCEANGDSPFSAAAARSMESRPDQASEHFTKIVHEREMLSPTSSHKNELI